MDKIKEIQTYQAVLFDKSRDFHFTSVEGAGKKSVSMLIIENTFVEVTNENDRVYIPLTNIKSIGFYNKSDAINASKRDEEKAKKPVANKIKRPR